MSNKGDSDYNYTLVLQGKEKMIGEKFSEMQGKGHLRPWSQLE